MRRLWHLYSVVAAVGVLGAPSAATADARADAKRHFQAGMQYIRDGQITQGIGELRRAHEILPNPNVLYNIGVAYSEIREWESAAEYLEEYVSSDPPDRGAVEQQIARLRERAQASRAVTLAPQPARPDTDIGAPALPPVEDEDFEAIEESALQIETLAEVSDSPMSPELRERAARLRALAEELETYQHRVAVVTPVGEEREGEEGTGTDSSTVPPSAATDLDLDPVREEGIYEEQVVSASRAVESPLDAPSSLSIVTAQDLRMSGLQSIPEVLRRVAGVGVFCSQAQSCAGGVAIRGMNHRLNPRVLVLIDGRSVYQDFLGATYWNMLPINTEDIERIEVIRGPASALYGADAFTGIINIITRDPGDAQSFVQARAGNHGILNVHGTASGRLDRLSYRFSVGHEQADRYSAPPQPRPDIAIAEEDIGLERTWARGDLRYNLGEGYYLRGGVGATSGSWSALAIGRLREVQFSDVFFTQAYASLTTPFGLAVRTFWNRLSVDAYDLSAGPGDVALEPSLGATDVLDVELEWLRKFHFVFDHELLVGVGYRAKSIDDYPIIAGDQFENHLAVFLQESLHFTSWLSLVASARVDRHPLLDDPVLSPRGALILKPTQSSAIRAQAGTAFRTPTFLESYLDANLTTGPRGLGVRSIGSTELEPERITSFELGYTSQDVDFVSIELNGYVNFIDGIISLLTRPDTRLSDYESGGARFDPGSETFEVAGFEFRNTAAEYRQIGGEAGVRVFPVEGLDVYLNYAITDLELTSGSRDPEDSTFVDDRDSTHMVNAGVQYRSSVGLDVAIDLHWQSSQRWVEPDAASGYLERTLPSYTLLSARVAQRLLDDRLELSVTGINLLFDDFRQHPYGGPTDTRVIGDLTFRF